MIETPTMPDGDSGHASPAPTLPEHLPAEVVHVDERTVACEGIGGALGHPRVYLRIEGSARRIMCPYCSRLFVLNEGAGDDHH
jgi:uncharacterized Zn-finger protein